MFLSVAVPHQYGMDPGAADEIVRPFDVYALFQKIGSCREIGNRIFSVCLCGGNGSADRFRVIVFAIAFCTEIPFCIKYFFRETAASGSRHWRNFSDAPQKSAAGRQ